MRASALAGAVILTLAADVAVLRTRVSQVADFSHVIRSGDFRGYRERDPDPADSPPDPCRPDAILASPPALSSSRYFEASADVRLLTIRVARWHAAGGAKRAFDEVRTRLGRCRSYDVVGPNGVVTVFTYEPVRGVSIGDAAIRVDAGGGGSGQAAVTVLEYGYVVRSGPYLLDVRVRVQGAESGDATAAAAARCWAELVTARTRGREPTPCEDGAS